MAHGKQYAQKGAFPAKVHLWLRSQIAPDTSQIDDAASSQLE